MRIAAIDIGTNSVHMIVVQVRPDLSFEVIDREKEMVRLGAGGLGGRALRPEAMHAARQALSKFQRVAESHHVDEIRAAATSAVREAENGREFLADIERATGIRAQVISGQEEARLIHRAAVYGVDAGKEDAVVVDIGGGSVEVTLGSAAAVRLSHSFKLGVILALGTMAYAAEHDRVPDEVRNLRVSTKALHRLRKAIVAADTATRLGLPGLDPRRADLVVAGSVLLDTILRLLGASELTLCDYALREGLVLDYIARNRRQIAQIDQFPDVRRRSVVELCERCRYGPEHARQVARLAGSLFDQTRGVHGLTEREREWLEYAALMHDIGEHISYSRHHKHSYYLVKNGDLRGFEPDEIEIIALVARYHRSARPKKSHDAYLDLAREDRRRVRTLAAILRLAEGLERSHAQVVSILELQDRRKDYLLKVQARGDAELELWAARRQLAPFEALVGRPVSLTADGTDHAEYAHDAASVPGQALRGGRHRRVGKDDAAVAAGQVAGRDRTPSVRH